MKSGWKVTIFGTDTMLPFVTERAARAEFVRRCHEGQRAYLWKWSAATEGEPAGFDIYMGWGDVERAEDAKADGYNPWISEDSDMERARGIDP